MSQLARWKVYQDQSHLVLVAPGERVQFWCNMHGPASTTFNQLQDAQYEPRCTSCVDALTRFHRDALVPLPDTMIEVVRVVVERPFDAGKGAVADHIERALRRKKTWVLVGDVTTEERPAE